MFAMNQLNLEQLHILSYFPPPQHFYVYIIKIKKLALVMKKEQGQASFA